ncbi:MAG TPA: YlxR family protein [Anaerolineales bacterium]
MKKGRRKHVPQRTCVGCREILPKRSLIRIVRSPEGIQIDPTGKLPGRGAYLHDRRSCWERGLKGALAHALRTSLSELDRERILKFMASLPDEESPGRMRSARTEPGRSKPEQA